MRGGAEQFIEETERSLHDAIMIVRRAMKNDSVVAGMSYGTAQGACFAQHNTKLVAVEKVSFPLPCQVGEP